VWAARIAPAHRSELRRFLIRFAGQRLEVALEATTGWRFVVEELCAIDAERISPSRRKPRRYAGPRSARSPIASMPGTCASC
jgi:hypothetical protein